MKTFFVFVLSLVTTHAAFAFDILPQNNADARAIRINVIYDDAGHAQRVGFCLQESLGVCRQIGKNRDYAIDTLKRQRRMEFAKIAGKSLGIGATSLAAGAVAVGGVYAGAMILFADAGASIIPGLGAVLIPVFVGPSTAIAVGQLSTSLLDPARNFKKARILRDDVITDVDVVEDIDRAAALLSDVLNSIE